MVIYILKIPNSKSKAFRSFGFFHHKNSITNFKKGQFWRTTKERDIIKNCFMNLFCFIYKTTIIKKFLTRKKFFWPTWAYLDESFRENVQRDALFYSVSCNRFIKITKYIIYIDILLVIYIAMYPNRYSDYFLDKATRCQNNLNPKKLDYEKKMYLKTVSFETYIKTHI